jgi:glycosyl transferase family 25
MKCLVINLDRSFDRLAHMHGEFARIGTPFQRIPAIDAGMRPELAGADLPIDPFSGFRMTVAELCCFLSHRTCWEVIAAGNDPYCAVFEDDMVFCDGAGAGALLADHGWIPADADIVKLETFFQRVVLDRAGPDAGGGFRSRRLRSLHYGCGGYVLSRQAARRMMDAAGRIDMPVDHFLFDTALAGVRERVIYQLVPALCMQTRFSVGGNGLASLLAQERDEARWVNPPPRVKRPTVVRIGRELRRIWRKLSPQTLVRFEHPQSPVHGASGAAQYTAMAKRAIDPA